VRSFVFPSIARALARHVARLRIALDDLAYRLREGVASAIGRVTDDFSRETVHAFPGQLTGSPASLHPDALFYDNGEQFGHDRQE
jgi:hypothetical protein